MLAPEWMKNARFPFGCVLIANRGEVACRIARACKELELSPVAIYTSNDKDAPLLDLCDQNYFLERPCGNRFEHLLFIFFCLLHVLG